MRAIKVDRILTDKALFRCLADRLIPGLPPSLKVHLVTQVDETQHRDGISAFQSVLEGHTELQRLIIERDSESAEVVPLMRIEPGGRE